MNDEYFMKEALKEAKKAFDREEVPVGAVLVKDGKIIARGYNQVELLQDATAHAEMLCLTAGAGALENWRLEGTTLYSTLEPCCMCAGAILNARVKRLVWGAPDLRVGANGSWVDLFKNKHPIHALEITPRVLEAESADLMRTFFQKQRKIPAYTQMDSKVGNLAKPAPQIWDSEAAPKQLNLNKLSDTGGPKDADVRRSQKPTFESIWVYDSASR